MRHSLGISVGLIAAFLAGVGISPLVQREPPRLDSQRDELRGLLARKTDELARLRDELESLRSDVPIEKNEREPVAIDDERPAPDATRETERLRTELDHAQAEAARLSALLERAWNDPREDLRERFAASDLVRGYTEEERGLLFSYVVSRMRRLPKPEQIAPALAAVVRYRAAVKDLTWKLEDDPGGPLGNRKDPRAQELLRQLERATAQWTYDIHMAFPDDLDAAADITN